MTDYEPLPYRTVELPNPFGGPVLYTPETGSVMEDAADRAAELEPGTVLFTGYQHRGRGRGGGRSWESAADQGLLMVLITSAGEYQWPGGSVSLRTALGLARYLESIGLRPQIKWPNDLLVSDRKVSGILGGLSSGWLRIGIGLNCRQRSFPGEFRSRTTSLVLEGAEDLPPAEHLGKLLPYLQAALEQEQIRGDVERRLFRIGEQMLLLEGAAEQPRRLRITIAGIREDGGLLYRRAGETSAAYAGECVLIRGESAQKS